MPVIIIGADTPLGPAIIEALAPRDAEIRAFVTALEGVDALRSRGIKVAVGDISDGSHVGGAALNAFDAVLLADAATDERERSFADTPEAVHAAWADGLGDAGVIRVIWVGDDPVPDVIRLAVAELAVVAPSGRTPSEVAREVAAADDAADVETMRPIDP